MDSLIILKKPLGKALRQKPAKPNKASVLPQNYSTCDISETCLLEFNVNETVQPNEKHKISFVKLYFDACLNNEKNKDRSVSGGDAPVPPSVTTTLVMEMDYGLK